MQHFDKRTDTVYIFLKKQANLTQSIALLFIVNLSIKLNKKQEMSKFQCRY